MEHCLVHHYAYSPLHNKDQHTPMGLCGPCPLPRHLFPPPAFALGRSLTIIRTTKLGRVSLGLENFVDFSFSKYSHSWVSKIIISSGLKLISSDLSSSSFPVPNPCCWCLSRREAWAWVVMVAMKAARLTGTNLMMRPWCGVSKDIW